MIVSGPLLVAYEVRRRQFQALPGLCWSGLRRESDDRTPAKSSRMSNPAHVLGEPLYPQAMEVDTDNLRAEFSASSPTRLGGSLRRIRLDQ